MITDPYLIMKEDPIVDTIPNIEIAVGLIISIWSLTATGNSLLPN